MKNFVECWHCQHYIWFSADSNNLFAECNIKNQIVFASEKVCEQFLLGESVHTKRDIPDYCVHYQNRKSKI